MAIFLTARQRSLLRGAIHEAKARYGKDARKAADIAAMMAFTESGCRILANANVPISKTLPHDLLPWSYDGLGHDHASIGPAQQQTGTKWALPGTTTMTTPDGWGTPPVLMSPQAFSLFFNAMDKDAPNWRTERGWVTAQKVQRSAYDGNPRPANNQSSVFGGNYLGQRRRAILVVRLLWATVSIKKPIPVIPKPKPKPAKPVKAGKKVYIKVRAGDTLTKIATNWNTDWRFLAKINNLADPDVIKVGQKLRVK